MASQMKLDDLSQERQRGIGPAVYGIPIPPLGVPDTETGGHVAFDPVADGDDDVQIVVLRVVGFAIGGSYPEFPDN